MEISLEFKNVSFGYTADHLVLKHVSLALEQGKTYALVGPTGGGKSTAAALMARLYTPTEGSVFYKGKNIQEYTAQELADEIGFILQEPFLFEGNAFDNIVYGNNRLQAMPQEAVEEELRIAGLADLYKKLPESENLSLGQKQIVAFLRAILRKPRFLILDEATANIDTITEQLLGKALQNLPKDTTKVIIAHRLNTIKNADGIFFVNDGKVTEAGNLEHALELIEKSKKKS